VFFYKQSLIVATWLQQKWASQLSVFPCQKNPV
jgi:hypothetical protein